MKWTSDDIPELRGKTAIVTGANAGIGYETARALAHKGAQVVLACRSEARGTAALERLRAESPAGTVELSLLDLASLASVRAFAERVGGGHQRLDALINNAGVMMPPRSLTEDGFELQIGVNFLGHYALTGLLWDLLSRTPGARVVSLGSLAHRGGAIDLDSFTGDKPYKAWRAYQQSKLACLMFALELARRAGDAGTDVTSVAAHPGATSTELQRHSGFMAFGARLAGMSAAQGALPTLFAATAPGVEPGGYYGPGGIYEARGYPAPAKIAGRARNRDVAEALWRAAEQATGVRYLSAG